MLALGIQDETMHEMRGTLKECLSFTLVLVYQDTPLLKIQGCRCAYGLISPPKYEKKNQKTGKKEWVSQVWFDRFLYQGLMTRLEDSPVYQAAVIRQKLDPLTPLESHPIFKDRKKKTAPAPI